MMRRDVCGLLEVVSISIEPLTVTTFLCLSCPARCYRSITTLSLLVLFRT